MAGDWNFEEVCNGSQSAQFARFKASPASNLIPSPAPTLEQLLRLIGHVSIHQTPLAAVFAAKETAPCAALEFADAIEVHHAQMTLRTDNALLSRFVAKA